MKFTFHELVILIITIFLIIIILLFSSYYYYISTRKSPVNLHLYKSIEEKAKQLENEVNHYKTSQNVLKTNYESLQIENQLYDIKLKDYENIKKNLELNIKNYNSLIKSKDELIAKTEKDFKESINNQESSENILQEFQVMIKENEKIIDSKTKKIEELEYIIIENETKKISLIEGDKTKLEKNVRNIWDLKKQKEDLNNQIAELKSNYNISLENSTKLTHSLDEIKDKYSKLDSKHTKIKTKYDEAVNTINNLTINTKYDYIYISYFNDAAKLKQELIDSINDKYEQQIIDQGGKIEFLNDILDNSISNKDFEIIKNDYDKEITILKEKIQINYEELASRDNTIKDLLLNLQYAEISEKTLNIKNGQYTSEMVCEFDSLKLQLTSANELYNELQDNYIELQKSKKKVQEQNSQIQQLLDIKSDELDKLDKKTNDQDNIIREMKEEYLKQLKEEKTKLNNKITIKDNKINELSQSFSDAKYTLDKLESLRITYDNEIKNKNQEIKTLNMMLIQKDDALSKYKSVYTDLHVENIKLEFETIMKEKESQIQVMQETIDVITKKYDTILKEYDYNTNYEVYQSYNSQYGSEKDKFATVHLKNLSNLNSNERIYNNQSNLSSKDKIVKHDSKDRNVHPNIQILKKDLNSLQTVNEKNNDQISIKSYQSDLYKQDYINDANLKFNTLFKKDSDRVAYFSDAIYDESYDQVSDNNVYFSRNVNHEAENSNMNKVLSNQYTEIDKLNTRLQTEINQKNQIYLEYQNLCDLNTKNQEHINKLQFEVKREQKMNDRLEQVEKENIILKTKISDDASEKKNKNSSGVNVKSELQKLTDELAAVQQFYIDSKENIVALNKKNKILKEDLKQKTSMLEELSKLYDDIKCNYDTNKYKHDGHYEVKMTAIVTKYETQLKLKDETITKLESIIVEMKNIKTNMNYSRDYTNNNYITSNPTTVLNNKPNSKYNSPARDIANNDYISYKFNEDQDEKIIQNVSCSKQLSDSKDDNMSLNSSRPGNDNSINFLKSPITKKSNKSHKIDSVETNSEYANLNNLFNHQSHVSKKLDYKSSQYSTLAKENNIPSNSYKRHHNKDSINYYNNCMEIDLNDQSTNRKYSYSLEMKLKKEVYNKSYKQDEFDLITTDDKMYKFKESIAKFYDKKEANQMNSSNSRSNHILLNELYSSNKNNITRKIPKEKILSADRYKHTYKTMKDSNEKHKIKNNMSVTSHKNLDDNHNISIKNLSKNLSYTDLGDENSHSFKSSSKTSGQKKNIRMSSPKWKY